MSLLAMCMFSLGMMAQGIPAQTYMNPKLVSKEKTIGSVALLPPTAQMKAIGVIREDIKEKEAEPLASRVGILMSNTLKKRGWAVNDTLFADRAVQEKEDLKNPVGFLCFRHQTFVEQIRPKDVAKGGCLLSNRVAALGAKIPVDAFVLVHADGKRITTASWLVTPVESLVLDALEKDVILRISLVDSQTGEILSYSETSSGETEILKELQKIP